MRYLVLFVLSFLVDQVKAQCITGLKFDLDSYLEVPLPPDLVIENLPDHVSLRTFCPNPANQLDFPTSAGWATSYYALTILSALEGSLSVDSDLTKNALSPTYPFVVASKDRDIECSEPITIVESLRALVLEGAPKFTEYPFFCPKSESSQHQKQRLSGFNRLFDTNESSSGKVDKIKAALHQKLPIVIALKVSNSFCDAGKLWEPSKYDPNLQYPLHAICIIGYDNEKNGGSFELVNSWGKSWGDGGFVHMTYKDLIPRIAEAYVLYKLPTSQKINIQIKPKLSTGSQMPIRNVDDNQYEFMSTYGSGNQFYYEIVGNFRGYVYLYYYNDRNESAIIYPQDEQVAAGAFPFSEGKVRVPNKGRNIVMDRRPGIEKMVFVFSLQPLSKEEVRDASKTTKVSFAFSQQEIKAQGTLDVSDQALSIELTMVHQ